MKLLQYIKENGLTHKEVLDILEEYQNGKPFIPKVKPKPIDIEEKQNDKPEPTDDDYWNVPEPPPEEIPKTPKELLSQFDIIDFVDGFYTYKDGSKIRRLYIYSGKIYLDGYTENYHKTIFDRDKRDYCG